MVKKITWTPEAEKTFESVIDYLQQYWSEWEIKNFIERADSVTEQITRHPLSYRSSGKEDVREALITKQSLLLYRVSGDVIYLLYFWDTRKNPERKPKLL